MKLKTQIVLTTHLVLIVASVLFGLFTYVAAHRAFIQELDAQLLATATVVKEIVLESVSDEAFALESADALLDRAAATKTLRLAELLGVSHFSVMKRLDGTFVTPGDHEPAEPTWEDRLLSVPKNVLLLKLAGDAMVPQHVDMAIDERMMRMTLFPFYVKGTLNLSVVGVDRHVMSGINRDILSLIAVFCLLAMLVAMLIDFYLVRAISRPVEQLTPDQRRDGEMLPSTGSDEIRMLAENINKMSEAIKKTMAQCREVEQSLRASEHMCRFLTEHTSDVVWSLDQDLRFDYISPSDEKFRGFAAEEVLGKEVWEAIDPADVTRFREDTEFIEKELVYIKASQSRTYELHLIRKNGEPLLAEVSVTAYINAAGEIKGYHGKVHDIRERRRLEEERSRVERLQSVGTLAGGIAHDFNNILMGLFGNIELAKDLIDPDSHAYTLLAEAGHSMDRAVRLTKQLLVFSKGGDPQKKNDVDIASLAKDVAEFDLSGSNLKLVFTQDDGPHKTAVDNGQIEQAISNIVINARQAMPEGGSIYFNVQHVNLAQDEHLQLDAGPYVRVLIRDEGPGMPLVIMKRIFEPYFTTKQLGSGLGLATAYSIIEKHGGLLEVHSQTGEGCEFVFYLPIVQETGLSDADEASDMDIVQADPSRVSGGVLVMDDDVLICSLLEKMITSEGVHVETVTNADDALAAYRQALENDRPFACAILDLTISGGVGGAEVVHELKAIDPDLFAIATSGYVESDVMSDCRDFGFDTVIAKPYSRTEVITLLERIGVIPFDRGLEEQ